MKVFSINPGIQTSQKSPVYKGKLSDKTERLFENFINASEKCQLKSNNSKASYNDGTFKQIYNNLKIIMERFGNSCKLDFEQLGQTQTHRFFIGSDYSYYKLVVGDADLPGMGIPKDEEQLGNIVHKLAKINPYEVNTKFIIQKIQNCDDTKFKPDKDYMFLEEKLLKM